MSIITTEITFVEHSSIQTDSLLQEIAILAKQCAAIFTSRLTNFTVQYGFWDIRFLISKMTGLWIVAVSCNEFTSLLLVGCHLKKSPVAVLNLWQWTLHTSMLQLQQPPAANQTWSCCKQWVEFLLLHLKMLKGKLDSRMLVLDNETQSSTSIHLFRSCIST